MDRAAEARANALRILESLATRETCQVCGSSSHTTDDHLPITSLLDSEPEDPRIGRAEDARDFPEDHPRGQETW